MPSNHAYACNKATVFARLIETSSFKMDTYAEQSRLSPTYVKTVCRDHRSGRKLSEKVSQNAGVPQSVFLLLKTDNTGYMEWTNSEICPNGKLRFELKRAEGLRRLAKRLQ